MKDESENSEKSDDLIKSKILSKYFFQKPRTSQMTRAQITGSSISFPAHFSEHRSSISSTDISWGIPCTEDPSIHPWYGRSLARVGMGLHPSIESTGWHCKTEPSCCWGGNCSRGGWRAWVHLGSHRCWDHTKHRSPHWLEKNRFSIFFIKISMKQTHVFHFFLHISMTHKQKKLVFHVFFLRFRWTTTEQTWISSEFKWKTCFESNLEHDWCQAWFQRV